MSFSTRLETSRHNFFAIFCIISMLCVVSSCGKGHVAAPTKGRTGPSKTYTVWGKTYHPLPSAKGFTQDGIASWYGQKFHGRKTSNGETYDMEEMTAAHKLLPFGTYVEVSNKDNGKKTVVRINDRGPFVDGRIIDLSKAAARKINMLGPGTARVHIKAVGYADNGPKTRPGTASTTRAESTPPQFGPFTVQVGAFTSESNAWRLAAKLRVQNPDVQVVKFDRGDQIFYRVRVGKENQLADAEKLQATLRTNGFSHAFVVAYQ